MIEKKLKNYLDAYVKQYYTWGGGGGFCVLKKKICKYMVKKS